MFGLETSKYFQYKFYVNRVVDYKYFTDPGWMIKSSKYMVIQILKF